MPEMRPDSDMGIFAQRSDQRSCQRSDAHVFDEETEVDWRDPRNDVPIAFSLAGEL